MHSMNKIIVFLLITLLISTPKNTVKAAEVPTTSVQVTASDITSKTLEATSALVSTSLQSPVVEVKIIAASIPVKPKTLKETAKEMVDKAFGAGEFKAFDAIVHKESTWNPEAVNPSSGACGLPQALPCSKIKDKSPEGQVKWMIDYIADRYGTPSNAWRIWQTQGWY